MDCLRKRPNSTHEKFNEEWNAFDNHCFRWYYVSAAATEPFIILVYWLPHLLYTWKNEKDKVRAAWYHLRQYETALDVMYLVTSVLFSVASCALVIVWMVLAFLHTSYLNAVFSIAVSVLWLFCLPILRWNVLFPSFWRIIHDILLKDIVRFVYLLVIVLIAFSYAFEALFLISETLMDEYSSTDDTSFMAFNLMLGMGDLFTADFERSISEAGGSVLFLKCMYGVYMFLVAVLLLNLLIAMMNNTYKSTLSKQNVHQRLETLELAIGWERDLQLFRRFGFRLCSTQFHRVPVGTDEDDEDTTELDPRQNKLKEKEDSMEQRLLATERKLDDIRSMLLKWKDSKKN